MALASAACGSGDGGGAHPDPDLDIDSSDKGALLHHADAEANGSCQLPDGPRTVHQMKGPPGSLQGGCAPTWTQEQLNDGFAEIRDRRMITLPEDPDFDPSGISGRTGWRAWSSPPSTSSGTTSSKA
ncbi:hypothetical protein WME75_35345 [Sorangium sp. So ce1014]|uniref:hypothetical protein n=1 Tax=Sorangium sp. So ce1014 TaxID=3133326 RepID=UPI003F6482EC